MGLQVMDSGRFRLTRREFQGIQRRAAKNGYAVREEEIRTPQDAMEAAIKAAPSRLVDTLLEFMEENTKTVTSTSSDDGSQPPQSP